jgi:hypothetical protein
MLLSSCYLVTFALLHDKANVTVMIVQVVRVVRVVLIVMHWVGSNFRFEPTCRSSRFALPFPLRRAREMNDCRV